MESVNFPSLRRSVGICAIALTTVLSACGGGSGSSASAPATPASASASATVEAPSPQPTSPPATETPPERTPSADCVDPPTGILDLIYQSDPPACYGSADLTVEGVVVGPGAVECPQDLVPTWYLCQNLVELGPLPGEAVKPFVLAARNTGPSLLAAFHPDLEMRELPDGAVRVTGHYDDPAAQTCQHTDLSPDDAAQEEAVTGCRATFVITLLEEL